MSEWVAELFGALVSLVEIGDWSLAECVPGSPNRRNECPAPAGAREGWGWGWGRVAWEGDHFTRSWARQVKEYMATTTIMFIAGDLKRWGLLAPAESFRVSVGEGNNRDHRLTNENCWNTDIHFIWNIIIGRIYRLEQKGGGVGGGGEWHSGIWKKSVVSK